MATWKRLVSNSTAGNISLNIDYAIQSVTRTSNTNVRVVYGIRFSMATSRYTYNSIAAFTPAGGTRRYAFNSDSGSYHTKSGTYYYANTTGNTTTSEICPFTQNINVTVTQTSASFEIGYGWDAHTPHQKGKSTISVTFPTGATAPTGLSCSVSNVTETECKLSGSYATDGNSTITATGFQYKTESGSWTNCTSTLTNLSANTKYYFRYYATNSQGTSYSDGTTNTTTYNYPYIVSITTSNLEIGSTQKLNIYNPLKRECTIYMKKDSISGTQLGSLSITTTQGSGNYNLTPNSTTMYNSIPSAQEGICVYYIVSSNPSHTSGTVSGKYKIKGTEIPNFSDSNWSYSADKTNLTNTNQCIIKNYSTVTFTVNTKATSSYGASIVKYVYKWGNQSKDSTLGNSVTGGNNNILQVDAVDSRGLIKTTQKTLTSGDKYVPYNLPSLDYSNCYTHRTDGISNETKLTLRGNLSVMKFGTLGVANAINSVKYRVYDYSTNTWSSQFNIPVSSFTLQSSGYFSLNDYMIHANGTSGGFTTGKRYAIQIILKDASGSLGTLNSSNILITDGKIARDVYQDSEGNYHQGINGMADSNYTEKIYGNLNVQGNVISTSKVESDNINSKTVTATDYGEFPNGVRGKTIVGGSGTSGYFYVFDVTTTGTYQNQFISFDVLQRNRRGHIDLQFKSSGTKGTMEISTIRKQGNIDVYYTNSNNVFSLYIKKSENYDSMEIINLEKGSYMANTTITWKNTTVSSLPSGYVTVTMNSLINDIYPVGSIYMSYKSTSPATLFGGTWEQLKNHFLFATNATSGDKGGYGNGTGTSSGSTTLTAAQSGLPSHQHALQNANPGGTTVGWTNYGVDAVTNKGYTGNVKTGLTGGLSASEGHTHTIPYIEVYVWRRTA